MRDDARVAFGLEHAAAEREALADALPRQLRATFALFDASGHRRVSLMEVLSAMLLCAQVRCRHS